MFEINLVPDVKAEMIRAQKKRNVVFFAAATVSVIAAGLVLLLLSVKIGQDVIIGNKDNQLELMSSTLQKYDGLDELLTVQKQMADLRTIGENKTMLSRVFPVLHSIVEAENGDEINISSLDVNLNDSEVTELSFDGQANAGANTDGIDYRVLESFTKSISLMKYDFGRYVDINGEEIPTMCIFESGTDGVPFQDEKGIYALWKKGAEDCDPSKVNEGQDDEEYKSEAAISNGKQLQDVQLPSNCAGADGTDVVCIRRTPQFNEWYSKNYLQLDGTISGIPHFESQCIQYSGTETSSSPQWSCTNNDCVMSPDGIEITSSTNGKEAGGELVLMFSAILRIDRNVFNFNNKHMITITPSGRQNVTDSFVQVGDMFTERAKAIGTEE